jgi:hypothetical protein
MKQFKFLARFMPEVYEKRGISKKYFVLTPDKNSIETLGANLKELTKIQTEKKQLLTLTVTISTPNKRHTENQRHTLFYLLKILASEMNANKKFTREATTPNMLYKDYIKMFCKSSSVIADSEISHYLIDGYSINEVKKIDDNKSKVTVWRSFSHMTTAEASEMIDYFLNVLAEIGTDINIGAHIEAERRNYRQGLNDNEIVLYDECSIDEYKQRNQSCEACGKFIGSGGGSMAHISARGMGGNQAAWKDTPYNMLRLCDYCHMEFDNNAGRFEFTKKYQWLKYKIERSIKRSVENVNT